jgi:predicted RNA binding protein YcfA (HicA-like mRNA interferase family)
MPRDLDAGELIRALGRLGYQTVRQTGSHIRIRTTRDGEHQETIPWHKPLKVGTLSAILSSIGVHHGLNRDELLELLDL